MNETAVKELDALDQARSHTERTETWSESESAIAFALIAIAEELRELNAQLKRQAVNAALQARNHWQLP